MDIDTTDFAILKCVRDQGSPLWKNKIHECIADRVAVLPLPEPVSVQTVGRRVDALVEAEYLESCIVSPDGIQRDLIIAYQLTDRARDTLQEKTETYLKRLVRTEVFDDEQLAGMGKPAILELMQERFDLAEDIREDLRQLGRGELVILLTLYYVREEITDVLSQDHMDRFCAIVDTDTELAESIRQYFSQQPA